MSTRTEPIYSPALRRSETQRQPGSLLPLFLFFGGFKLLLQTTLTLLSEHAGYGIHRDELYYLVCGHRLALGYVDQPPLVALQARLAEEVFGIHHLALFRLLPALAGALTVALTGLIAQAMGGSRRACSLAMLAVLTAPIYLATQSFLSMNAWEPVFWMGAVLAVLQLLPNPARQGWWVLLGASAGLGLENKISTIFFIAALLVALAATPGRRLLRTRGFGLACGITVLLALPNLYWQATHHFATLEWLRDVAHSNKDVVLSPPAFLIQQCMMLGPLHLLVWLPGALWLLRARAACPLRSMGVLFLAFLALMLGLHAKDYYVAPIYPLLFAAGAVFWSEWAGQLRPRIGAFRGYTVLLTGALLFTVPFAVPVISPAKYEQFVRLVHVQPMESEQHPGVNFPEFFADHLGWQGLAKAVNRVYRALPPEQQRQTGIIAGNYGQASALNILGRPLGLPAAISGHQNYWMWGPGAYTGKEMIVVGDASLGDLLKFYRTCTLEARQTGLYQMPWEQRSIYLCRDRYESFAQSWASMKYYR